MHIKIVNGNTKVNQDTANKSYNNQGSGNSKCNTDMFSLLPYKTDDIRYMFATNR